MKRKRISKKSKLFILSALVLVGAGFGVWRASQKTTPEPSRQATMPRTSEFLSKLPVVTASGSPKRYDIANSSYHVTVPAGWHYDASTASDRSSVTFYSPDEYIHITISDGRYQWPYFEPTTSPTKYIESQSISVMEQTYYLNYSVGAHEGGEYVRALLSPKANSDECLLEPGSPNDDYHTKIGLCVLLTGWKRGSDIGNITGQAYFAQGKQIIESLSK